jgi:hypothetical protein
MAGSATEWTGSAELGMGRLRRSGVRLAVCVTAATVALVALWPWLLSSYRHAVLFERHESFKAVDGFFLSPGSGQGFMIGLVVGCYLLVALLPFAIWAREARRALSAGPARLRHPAAVVAAQLSLVAWFICASAGLLICAVYAVVVWDTEDLVAPLAVCGLAGLVGSGVSACFAIVFLEAATRSGSE